MMNLMTGSVVTEKGERTMPNTEKVIIGLEICASRNGTCQYKQEPICPYAEYCQKEHYASLQRDALALLKEQEEQIKNRDESLEKAREEIKWLRGMLKEQEAVAPKCKEHMGGFVTGVCPTCGAALNNVHNAKACGKCGQAVKWE